MNKEKEESKNVYHLDLTYIVIFVLAMAFATFGFYATIKFMPPIKVEIVN